MSLDFSGKSAVVTGASSGIGWQVAWDFARRGAHVALVARDAKKLALAKNKIEDAGGRASVVRADVGDARQAKRACAVIKKRFARVDVLVNNAGFGVFGSFEKTADAQMREMFDTNFWGAVYFTRGLLPKMGAGSRIVNVGSIAGKAGLKHFSGYCATKFALAGFSESLYHDLRERGIGVHLVAPGAVVTRFHDHPSFERARDASAGMEKKLSPEEVSAAVFEAMERNRFETVLDANRSTLLGLRFRALFPNAFVWLLSRRYGKK